MIILCCILVMRIASWKVRSFLLSCFSLVFFIVSGSCEKNSRRAYEARKIGMHRRPRCNSRYHINAVSQYNSFEYANLQSCNPSKVILVKVSSTQNRVSISNRQKQWNKCKPGRSQWHDSTVHQEQAIELYFKCLYKMVTSTKASVVGNFGSILQAHLLHCWEHN